MSSTLTLNVSQQTLEAMYLHYSNQIIKVPAHTMFQAKTSHCTITAYLSKKVVFQGQAPQLEAAKWEKSATPASPKSKTAKVTSTALPANVKTLSAVGSDEVGTGDYLGPIVVCCAYVPADLIEPLLNLGIRDSKQLHDDTISQLANQIKQHISYHCILLPNEMYNKMVDKGMNANSIKAFLHNKALLALQEKMKMMPDYVIMDEFANESLYYRYLKNLPSKPEIYSKNLYFVQKGEGVHVSVAAASIIARATFVEYMDATAKSIGLPIPKGASQAVDQAAATICTLKGEDALKKIAKWHFANTKKFKNYCK